MRRALALLAVIAVAACQTLPQVVVRNDDLFDVRYDATAQTEAEADAKARAHCMDKPAVFVSQETRFDGLAYRTYACARS